MFLYNVSFFLTLQSSLGMLITQTTTKGLWAVHTERNSCKVMYLGLLHRMSTGEHLRITGKTGFTHKFASTHLDSYDHSTDFICCPLILCFSATQMKV